jgi:pimeloyl-ACP methyl ester carboxylesterase
MATIVGVHGAFHQLWGPHEVAGRWVPAFRDGLWHAYATIDPDDVAMALYGDLFRSNVADGRPSDDDLLHIAQDAGLTDVVEAVAGPDGLEAIAKAVGKQTLRQLINQLGRYFTDDELRTVVRGRVEAVVTPETRVIIAHSMGTVVAYETLCEHPEWTVETFLTIGSPLGGDWVFDHLRPRVAGEVGVWPGSIKRWVNVASVGDEACAEPKLARRFGDRVIDLGVDNGHRAHDPEPHLNAPTTGQALASALGS